MRLLINLTRLTSLLSLYVFSITSGQVFAAPVDDAKRGVDAVTPTGSNTDINKTIKDVINILSFIVGAASVIMLIIGGIRYVLSQGNQEQIQSAKNTILYALVGIVLAFSAYGIVNWVINRL